MEIHSSSVYIAPAGIPAQDAKPSGNVTPATTSISEPDKLKNTSAISSGQAFETAAEKKQAQQLSLPSAKTQPLDTRTAQALSRYISTFNTVSQQTAASSLTGIDFYA